MTVLSRRPPNPVIALRETRGLARKLSNNQPCTAGDSGPAAGSALWDQRSGPRPEVGSHRKGLVMFKSLATAASLALVSIAFASAAQAGGCGGGGYGGGYS